MSDRPLCIIIAAYNAAATIGRAVRSALAQQQAREIIVVDDASTDGTADAARAADDHSGRLSIIELEDNGGPARARNIALERSAAPYVCVLDSDDYLLPGRLERLLSQAPQDWDLLADDIVIVPKTLEHVRLELRDPPAPLCCVQLDLATFVTANISHPTRPRAELGFLKPIMRRAFLQEHGLKYDDSLRLAEDYALYVQALMGGARFHLTSACGYIAIERGDSISSRHAAADLERIIRFDERCIAAGRHLTSAERRAFAGHRAATQHKLDYQTVLDRKRERGLASGLAALARLPRSHLYVLAQTLRARLPSVFRHDRGANDRIRLLAGLPRSGVTCEHASIAAPDPHWLSGAYGNPGVSDRAS
jgi:succinoglycan biosynthesis protein ExoU